MARKAGYGAPTRRRDRGQQDRGEEKSEERLELTHVRSPIIVLVGGG
jgi:hypothetical protein